jgi:hypothetical protein
MNERAGKRAVWALGVVIATASCGQSAGSATTGGGGGDASDWRQQCQTVVDHNAACGKASRDDVAVRECVASQPCVPSVWVTDVVASVMSCLATLPCDHPDDECISITAAQQTQTKNALFAACRDKAATCPGFNGCLETMFLLSDELALKLQACLGQACDAANTCVQTEYTAAITAAGCAGELPFGG